MSSACLMWPSPTSVPTSMPISSAEVHTSAATSPPIGTDGQSSPRHQTHIVSSFLDLNGMYGPTPSTIRN